MGLCLGQLLLSALLRDTMEAETIPWFTAVWLTGDRSRISKNSLNAFVFKGILHACIMHASCICTVNGIMSSVCQDNIELCSTTKATAWWPQDAPSEGGEV